LVIKTLTHAKTSLPPVEILKIMRKSGSINKVTLYRILTILEKNELIRKILTSDKTSRYELIDPLDNGKQNLAPHFTCRICKETIPINSPELTPLINKELDSKLFGPIEVTIEGICFKCKGGK